MYLSIFDLDKTLLKTNISYEYYLYLYKKKVYKKISIFQIIYFFLFYRIFKEDIRTFHIKIFNKYLKGKNADTIIKYVDVFLDKYLEIFFYKPAVLRLQEAIYNRHYIALYSSSPFFLVKPIADILKINDYKASIYKLDERNNFDKIDIIMDGNEKAKAAKTLIKELNISKENVYVYSDSIQDLKLFEVANNKIAVQPSYKLKKIFKKNNWEII